MITPQELREAASLSPMSAAKYNAAADTIEELNRQLQMADERQKFLEESERNLTEELKAEKENHRITMDQMKELDLEVEKLKEENARLEEQRGEAAEIAEQHTGE